MATPTPTTYTAASGVTIYGGRFAPPVLMSGDLILFGDSLTDPGYGSRLYSGSIARARNPNRVIRNSGVTNNTLDDMWARWLTDVVAHNPGIVMMRAGTNSTYVNDAQYVASYKRFTDDMVARGYYGVICAMPPRMGAAPTIKSRNLAAKALCESYSSGRIKFLDDCWGLAVDSDYTYNPALIPDGIHPGWQGNYIVGATGGPLLDAMLTPNDPRIVSSTDTYYLNSGSNQYVKNPMMVGTGGGGYFVDGVIPDFWAAGCNGSGTTGRGSIIAADVGDSNQTPWFNLEILTTGASAEISISTTLGHPAIAADLLTVKRLDCIMEVRFRNLDSSKFGAAFKLEVSQSSAGVAGNEIIGAANNGILNDTFLMRCSYERGLYGAPLAYPANTMVLTLSTGTVSVSASSAGSVSVRLASVRAQSN